MTRFPLWTLVFLLALAATGCDGKSGRYTEPDFLERDWSVEEHEVVDLERVVHEGGTAGFVKSVHHHEWNTTDFYVYDQSLRQVGYISEEGATYRYSKRFQKLQYEGHFDMQGSVRHLLHVQGGYYIIPANVEADYADLEAMQPSVAK